MPGVPRTIGGFTVYSFLDTLHSVLETSSVPDIREIESLLCVMYCATCTVTSVFADTTLGVPDRIGGSAPCSSEYILQDVPEMVTIPEIRDNGSLLCAVYSAMYTIAALSGIFVSGVSDKTSDTPAPGVPYLMGECTSMDILQ